MLSIILWSVGAALSVMLASLIGVLFMHRTFGSWMRARLTYLATFSGGVLTILAYHLIEESIHEGESFAIAAGSIVAGVVVLELIHHILPDNHEHHHHAEPSPHAHTPVDGRRVLLSDSIHNITDGFLIVPAFIADWRIGIAATIGIFFHELVQEISEFFILKEARYSDRKALALNFTASSTILIGIVMALTLASFENILAILSGFAAGGFLSVVIRDLLPHAIESAKAHRKWLPHGLAALIGISLMTGITMLAPHEHAEEDDHREEVALDV